MMTNGGLVEVYETPYERSLSAYDHANEGVLKLSVDGRLDPTAATHMRYQSASFEMLTAIHETLERMERLLSQIERNSRPAAEG